MSSEFCFACTVLGAPLTARLQPLDGGMRAEIYGGTRPHIGAVSIAGPDGKVSTTQFPAHRDGVVSARWAGALAAAGYRPAVVLAGIHYDHLDRAGIDQVVQATEHLLHQALETLAAKSYKIPAFFVCFADRLRLILGMALTYLFGFTAADLAEETETLRPARMNEENKYKKPCGVCQTPQGFCHFQVFSGTDQTRGADAKRPRPGGLISCLLCDTGSSCARRHF